MADEQADWNQQVIEEFRANAGVVGGHFAGKQLVLLHHVGRRTGRERVNPLVAARDGDAYLICGSLGGAPEDPQWVANVEAGPGRTVIETGTGEPVEVRTTVVRPDGPEWARLYGIWSTYWPDAKEYETRTDRKFPMVRLDPVG
jgi:deazaflavin-dependent oxidoreductase (nitroreductase family)